MIAELATCHDRFCQLSDAGAVGQQGGHLCQQAGVTNRLRTAQRVTQQFGRERAMELGLL